MLRRVNIEDNTVRDDSNKIDIEEMLKGNIGDNKNEEVGENKDI